MDIDLLKAALAKRKRREDSREKLAAVLVPIICDEGEPRLLLTRRTEGLPTHKGHVAFPGGRVDPGDSGVVDAALREAHEEVNLHRRSVEVVGQLDDFPTVTGDMIVTPVIGVIRHLPELIPARDEVARIFEVPIKALMDPDAWVMRNWNQDGQDFPVYYFDWDGEVLWGLSAYITLQLLSLMPEGGPVVLPAPYDHD